jgi:tetratricopeptide (TPR) repeat protein
MSQDTNPAPQPTPTKVGKPNRRNRLLIRLLIVGSLLGLVLIFTARPLYRFGKKHYAQYRAGQCLEHMESQQWLQAMKALSEANRYGPDDPVVLRATVTFLSKTSRDPRSLIVTMKRLIASGHGTPADYLTLAKAHLSVSEVAEARALHTSLPDDQRNSKDGLELLAQVLRAEGRATEAEDTLRRALMTDSKNPESKLRLALLDYENAFPEIQARARQTMWELADNKDKTALSAFTFLSRDKNLTAPEANRLLKAAEDHPDADPSHRLEILSAVMRINPHLREEILDAEVKRYEGKPIPQLVGVVAWLAREKQHTRILKLVSPQVAFQSQEIFPYVAQALGEEGRWADLRRMLTGSQAMPVQGARVQVWLAQAASKIDPSDRDTPRQHLENAVELASKNDDLGSLASAAQVSEEQGLYTLSIRAYERIAKASPRNEIEMLEKVYELALRNRDTPKLFEIGERICELRPGSGLYRDRIQYLTLLTGNRMETVALSLATHYGQSIVEGQTTRIPSALLQALSAYRFRDSTALDASLLALQSHYPNLTPGQRAVTVGLLRSAGRAVDAFRLAESINATLLLPEEEVFLGSK